MCWWEISGGAGGSEGFLHKAGPEGPHCTWEKNKAPSSGKRWRVLLLSCSSSEQVVPLASGL